MGDDPVAWGKIGLVEKAIKTLNESTTKLSKRMIFLNWILVILTAVILGLTIVLVIRG